MKSKFYLSLFHKLIIGTMLMLSSGLSVAASYGPDDYICPITIWACYHINGLAKKPLYNSQILDENKQFEWLPNNTVSEGADTLVEETVLTGYNELYINILGIDPNVGTIMSTLNQNSKGVGIHRPMEFLISESVYSKTYRARIAEAYFDANFDYDKTYMLKEVETVRDGYLTKLFGTKIYLFERWVQPHMEVKERSKLGNAYIDKCKYRTFNTLCTKGARTRASYSRNDKTKPNYQLHPFNVPGGPYDLTEQKTLSNWRVTVHFGYPRGLSILSAAFTLVYPTAFYNCYFVRPAENYYKFGPYPNATLYTSTDSINAWVTYGGPAGSDLGVFLQCVGKSPTYSSKRVYEVQPVADDPGSVIWQIGTGLPGYRDDQEKYAQFRNPSGIVVDPDGVIYVADSGNNAIRKIYKHPVYSHLVVRTLAGGGANQTGEAGYKDGQGVNARFSYPMGLAFSYPENSTKPEYLIVADTLNHAIRKVDFSGNVTTIKANFSSGRPVAVLKYDDLNQLKTTWGLNTPTSVATFGSKYLFIANSANKHVLMVDYKSAVNNVASFFNTYCTHTEVSTSTCPTSKQFKNPSSILVVGNISSETGADFALFVTDREGPTFDPKLPSYNTRTQIHQILHKNGAFAAVRSMKSDLGNPVGMALDSRNVFLYSVDEFGSSMQRANVLRSGKFMNASGVVIDPADSMDDETMEAGKKVFGQKLVRKEFFNSPWGIAFDPNSTVTTNNLFVTDRGGHSIKKIKFNYTYKEASQGRCESNCEISPFFTINTDPNRVFFRFYRKNISLGPGNIMLDARTGKETSLYEFVYFTALDSDGNPHDPRWPELNGLISDPTKMNSTMPDGGICKIPEAGVKFKDQKGC